MLERRNNFYYHPERKSKNKVNGRNRNKQAESGTADEKEGGDSGIMQKKKSEDIH